MSYTLDITFTGMCGFVPVDQANERAVHVLFPNTARPDAHGPSHEGRGDHDAHGDHASHGAHEGNGRMEVHVSRLQFDMTALWGGAPQVTGWPVVVSLRNRVLELGGGTWQLNPILTSNLAPLQYLKPGFLGDAANDYITTRVVLRAGREVWADPGAVWEDQEGNERPMSHRLVWRMAGLTEPLALTLRSLEGKPDQKLPALYPDASGKLSLHILHVPPAELPPEPQEVDEPERGTVAHHFAALNLLVTEPVKTLPRFVRRPEKDPEPPLMVPPIDRPDRGLSPYACMGGRIAFNSTAA